MPCRNRKTISAPMSGAAAHATDSRVNATRPASSGFLRPSPSLTGPATSCPTASPARQPDSVSCTSDCEACRFAAIVGVDGRYMSIESGPNEDSAPSTASIPIRRCCLTAGATKVSIANEWYAGLASAPTCRSPVVAAPFRRSEQEHHPERLRLTQEGDRACPGLAGPGPCRTLPGGCGNG